MSDDNCFYGSPVSSRFQSFLQTDSDTDFASPSNSREDGLSLSSGATFTTLQEVATHTFVDLAEVLALMPPSPVAEPQGATDSPNGIGAIAPISSLAADRVTGLPAQSSLTGPTTESNDSLTQAIHTRLNPNNPGTISLTGRIGDNLDRDAGLDVDFYVVQLAAGDRLTLDIDANESGSSLDSGLRLFDAMGNEIARSDDSAAPDDEALSLDSYLDFTATTAGNYYVAVSGFDNLDYNPFAPGSGTPGSTGDYQLTLSLFTRAAESNDSLTTATFTGLTNQTPGTANYMGAIGDNPNTNPTFDTDFYAVQLGAGDTFTADLDVTPDSYLDAVFRLFDAQGNEVTFSYDNTAPGEDPSYDPFLSFTATEAGNYFLGISGFGNFDYDPFVEASGISGGTGGYSLTLAVEAKQSDLVGDTIPDAYATDLSSDAPGTFTISTAIGDNPAFAPGLDVDFFSFQANQGDLVTVDLDFATGPNALTDSVLVLFDEQGNELSFSDDGAAPGESSTFESYLSFIAPRNGNYYVGVSGYSNWLYDPFTPGSGVEATSVGGYNLDITLTESPLDPNGDFNVFYGYGLVDAAAAVAAAIGADPFAAVASLGGDLWGLDQVNAPEAWAQGHTGEGVIVAVLDTGVDYLHPDLADNIWRNGGEIANNGIDDDSNGFVDDILGWNFINDTNDPTDWYDHGTHVSGTIAGINNGTGITGVAYDATIMPVSVIGDWLEQDEYEFLRDLADGIYYAVDNGADVINMSLGYAPAWYGGTLPTEADLVREAIAYAQNQGTVVVMASGNEYATQPGYPAIYATDWGISVGATTINTTLANFSNTAGYIEMDYLVAPGEDVYSTIPGGGYAYFSGTSMATPHVAGVAALIMAANPNLTAAEVEDILTRTANSSTVSV
ncbi:MAG: DVUA0089 family protein [Synechococcales bacterium]|nr:DVUA0089 family protein [Synechococcales bacterium]